MDRLRTLLVSTAKESAFRKVVQATMVRDRQHGPVVELNRCHLLPLLTTFFLISACPVLTPIPPRFNTKGKRSKNNSGSGPSSVVDKEGGRTVFSQVQVS